MREIGCQGVEEGGKNPGRMRRGGKGEQGNIEEKEK